MMDVRGKKKKKQRKDDVEISSNDDPSVAVDRNEMQELTRAAKSWQFTCTFCFKRFPSAQAMGGHQNAHRVERLEEKRLSVRDPIGHRKRVYLRAMKADKKPAGLHNNYDTSTKMVEPVFRLSTAADSGGVGAAAAVVEGNHHSSLPSSSSTKDSQGPNIINSDRESSSSTITIGLGWTRRSRISI